ncbi:MAG: HAD family phosphatase [Firmicutes bacterium]|nr:HAD family phosphatase [Bacillota bacterium]
MSKEINSGTANVKAVLLDLGGVLVRLTGVGRLIELAGGGIDPAELDKRWNNSRAVQKYESGLCDSAAFAGELLSELGMDISPQAFLDEFVLFAKDFYPGTPELLRALRRKYTVACLSNTNRLQWDGLRERIAIDGYFDRCFLSFEIGKMKPGPEIYAYAVKELGLEPDGIVYFDDLDANVRAGAEAGLRAYKVSGAEELRRKLVGMGLI